MSNTIAPLNQSMRHGNKFHIFAAIFFYISFFLLSVPANSAEAAPLVKIIEIKGNRKISSSTISSKMKSRAGLPFSKKSVQDDIKSLYSIGYFDDIRVEIEPFEGGVKLIYVFTEKPTIVSLDFQGNKEFETKDLKEKITITSGAIANLSLITDNVQRIISFYQSEGYWLVRVVPIIREISEDAAALTFQVEEGPKVTIKRITIEGNKALSVKEIKKVMKTKERWLFSFLTGSGIYKKEQIRQDVARIKELYQSKGYIYVAVSEPKIRLSPDKKKIFLTISISEGDQYKIGEVRIKGNKVFSDSELYDQIEIASGRIFNRSTLRKDIDKIIDMYMDRGYARADVNPLIDVNTKAKIANITLSITEGGIYKIGRIDITGNIKTRDKVIRREMRLDEGDIFSKKLIKRSYQRINNLNYFESVDVNPTPRVEEQLMDIDIKVKEKLTGMLSIGGGYSSVDKVMVMGEITQTNLFGKGLYLKLKADFSSRRTNYNISLRDPWFMNKPISASIGIYKEKFDYTDYDKEAMGGNIGFGKELSEYVGGNIMYRLEEVKITDVSENASSLIREQEGSKLTSSISPSVWRDTRDNYLDTATGSRNALYTTLAGLGGDNYFVKGVVDSRWYFPVIWETTFSLRGRYGYAAGYNGKELPLYERFYVGGINTIRGLNFGEGGPINEEGEKTGGTEELIFNIEYIFPIVDDIKLKGVLFFDYGGAFDKDHHLSFDNMRETAGAGLRWLSPFGPIRLEWGFNIDPKEGESGDKFEFSLGGLF
ncbi:outer membrane protein assembly factor BamA precursor [bacterium BMS3Abin06]|nr:outer membrane protein assembly factor BamA precursor [bacterium BMS3Abin06]